MKTNNMTKMIVTAGLAVGLCAVLSAVPVRADGFQHMGPGLGSVKTAPFYANGEQAAIARQNQAMSFHIVGQAPPPAVQISPKAPGVH
jgi:hypothetical protein